MRLYFKIMLFVVWSVLLFGVVTPNLISADDDLLVGLGMLGVVLLYPPAVIMYFQSELKALKEKTK